MTVNTRLTDRSALLKHRARATRQPAYFLHDEACFEIKERLSEVNKAFNAPVLVGHVSPPLSEMFPTAPTVADSDHLDLPQDRDLVVHAFGLHWADDPVGQMVQSRLALVPDGMFLGVMFAGETLQELRASLAEAEARLTGGLSPRVLPMGDLRDLGGLVQRAGLALPVADSRKITVRYRDLAGLFRDLRGMGETNALAARHKSIPHRNLFKLTEGIYRENFRDAEGYLLATFELVFLTGWAPSETQQKPLAPGSAQHRLADVLGVDEIASQE